MTRVLLSYLVLVVLSGPAMAVAFHRSIQCKTSGREFSLVRNDKGYLLIERHQGQVERRIFGFEAQYAETDCKRVTEAEFPLVCGGIPSFKFGEEDDAKPWQQRKPARFVTLFKRVYVPATYGVHKADAADISSYFALETSWPISQSMSITSRSFDEKDCTIND